MSSSNSRLLRPVVLHRRTEVLVVGCPKAKPGLTRRPRAMVHRPRGDGYSQMMVGR